MQTDREMLEFAARAAGVDVTMIDQDGQIEGYDVNGDAIVLKGWNPLTDDGDALRLAMKMGFTVEPGKCWHSPYGPAFGEDLLDGEMTATRRAIVRAAAEIGRAMPCAKS